MAALDLHKIQDMAKSVYTGTLACLASVNSLTVRRLSQAFDLGRVLCDDTKYIMTTILERSHSKDVMRVSQSVSVLSQYSAFPPLNHNIPNHTFFSSSSSLHVLSSHEIDPSTRDQTSHPLYCRSLGSYQRFDHCPYPCTKDESTH